MLRVYRDSQPTGRRRRRKEKMERLFAAGKNERPLYQMGRKKGGGGKAEEEEEKKMFFVALITLNLSTLLPQTGSTNDITFQHVVQIAFGSNVDLMYNEAIYMEYLSLVG